MHKILIAFVLLFTLSAKAASTILVSDIDDTLKLADVQHLVSAAKYALDDESRFMGMSELFRSIAHDNPGMKFYYVSKAPQWLMGNTHREFLANGKFPNGEYWPRTEYSADTHKFNTISSIIEEQNPQTVIFFGDNGEQDAQVYDRLRQRFSSQGIHFIQFIRDAYPTPFFGGKGAALEMGQKYFVTPVEVSLELEKEHLLQHASAEKLVNYLVPRISRERGSPDEGTVAFPEFVRCPDFIWYSDDSMSTYPTLQRLKDKIESRCQAQ